MSQDQAADPAGVTPPAAPGTEPGPATPFLSPQPAPGGMVKKTGRLLASAVMKTSELIVKTEEKVAEQWSRATGNALQFSGGFSWKKGEEGSGEVVRRWTAPMKAVKPRRRRWVWLALFGGLLILSGAGVWWSRRAAEPPLATEKPEPLF